tara:strand:- start:1675 stop:2184 length:510 start_codon:yes stop_codon:yes gene_type:complete
MVQDSPSVYVWSALTILIAILLQMLPLSAAAAHWRPQFVLLTVCYWLFRRPLLHGIGFAWLCGLALDFVIGDLIGRHALVFAICACILLLLQQRMRHFRLVHQAILVLLLVALSQCLVYVLTLILRFDWQGTVRLAPAVSSMLFWPVLVIVLSRLHWTRWGEEEISPGP